MELDNPYAVLNEEDIKQLPKDGWLERLVDRRYNPNGSWDYRWLLRDGTLSTWKTEDDALEVAMPWTLDTFHALYELKHVNDMPDYATRIPREDRRVSTKEAALALFPRGTKVVREERGALKQQVKYLWGTITGYLAPYWRVRYEDGDWEDFTKRQLQCAIALAEATQQRAKDLGVTVSSPKVVQEMCPGIPPDFGWSRGTLGEFYPARSQFTFDVLFDGEKTVSNTGFIRRQLLNGTIYQHACDAHDHLYVKAWVSVNGIGTTVALSVHWEVYRVFGEQQLVGKYDVDHKDNNPSNNHISNLQLLPHRENMMKRCINPPAHNTSGGMGVSWQVGIVVNGIRKHPKRFNSFEETVAYRDTLERRYNYGKYAVGAARIRAPL
ncbi:hypothetical protein JKP88DRAFT_281580 [Tribonema minus]|uniref:HNH nuclease domain-containing protein n=1 Tax=Tribonema minus TaxID=303371 RepID=A0A836C9C6_9STRA|nr:hypothetical protein JKP88DRAFT_281580 [Tribonema minus]